MPKQSNHTIKIPVPPLIIFLLLVLSVITNLYTFYISQINKQKYINNLQTYQVLNKYVCWYGIFDTTCYTLAKAECGKDKSHKEYGITHSGRRAVAGRTVAVDNAIVKEGSILIDLDSGIKYIAEDTGSKVHGYMVDIFVGEGTEANIKFAHAWGKQQREFLVIQ